MPDVLLDTSFLLPTLGVDVEEVTEADLKTLKDLSKADRFCCSYTSFVEILGLLGRVKRSLDDSTVSLGIKSLLESGTYKWVNPSSKAIQLALELRRKGHRDNIDNILYSTAFDSKMLFLSLDNELKSFLQRNGYDVKLIVRVKDLPDKIQQEEG